MITNKKINKLTQTALKNIKKALKDTHNVSHEFTYDKDTGDITYITFDLCDSNKKTWDHVCLSNIFCRFVLKGALSKYFWYNRDDIFEAGYPAVTLVRIDYQIHRITTIKAEAKKEYERKLAVADRLDKDLKAYCKLLRSLNV